MSKIIQLDSATINKIAAGEVIERPMSVVKELVENSIDAGASEIIIRLKDGGKKEIIVTDDGEGMSKEDLIICTKKHATSKIKSIEDIFSINSLGFRGEALATISQVSKTTITSAREEDSVSNSISIHDGKVIDISEDTKIKGTTIKVLNLFYSVPARQKFLKTAGYELKKIVDLIKKISIPNYKLSFKIYSEGKLLLDLRQKDSISLRIKEVFNLDLLKSDYSDSVVSAMVFFSSLTNATFSPKQIFYINNRPIKNDTISQAIYRSFESKIPRGKKPHSIVFIKIDPKIIDINVHPQKEEIRVRNKNTLYMPVYSAITKKLKEDIIESGDEIKTKVLSLFDSKLSYDDSLSRNEIPKEKGEKIGSSFIFKKLEDTQKKRGREPEKESKKYRIIGQLFDTYILVETIDNKLLMIDQHQAEERFNYENLHKNYIQDKQIKSQSLLSPIAIDIGAENIYLIEEKKNIFKELGFDLDVFGDTSIIIRKLPLVMDKIPSSEDLKELILDVALDNSNIDKKIDLIIATMACKASIKAGRPLREYDMARIVEKLFSTDNPYTCPHGRPILLELTKDHITKKIGRSG